MAGNTCDITSQTQPLTVEVASVVSITGQTLPAGADGQTLQFQASSGLWIAGPRHTVSQSQPSGGVDGDLWYVVT